jgi:hypothetical protein
MFSGSSLRLNIAPWDEVQERVVEIGGEQEVDWAIELGRLDGYDTLALCLKVKSSDGTTHLAGPVVNISVAGRRDVVVVLESILDETWVRVTLNVERYHFGIHQDWLVSDEISVLSMGLLPKNVTAQRVIDNVRIPPAELYNGFHYVKHWVMNDHSGVTMSPLTWLVDSLYFEAGLIKQNVKEPIHKRFVFGSGDFNVNDVQAYIDSLIPKEVQKRRAAAEDAGAPKQARKKSTAPVLVQKKRAAAEDTIPPKKARKTSTVAGPSKTPSGRRNPNPPLTRAVEKPEVTREIAKPAQSVKSSGGKPSLSLKVIPPSPSSPISRPVIASKKRSTDTTAAKSESSLKWEENDIKEIEEKKVKEGSEVLAKISRYYIWGIKQVFKIPVKLIRPAPPRLCYRKLNMDHVAKIAENMTNVPGVEPLIADLIPFNIKNGKVLDYQGSQTEMKAFQKNVDDGKIHFYAVSGQHSAKAAQCIQEWSKTNPNYLYIAKALEFRKARILSASTPPYVLDEHSSRCNLANLSMESTFLDTVIHARRQYIACGRPTKPPLGTNQTTLNNPHYKKFNVSSVPSV